MISNTKTIDSTEPIVFGGGCFWCTEAVFSELKGVKSVISGYAGGEEDNPNYAKVSTGTTGHAEVVMVEYDKNGITLRDLLEVFFATHDPTTKDRQGNDVGTQYRSMILYTNKSQKKMIDGYIAELRKVENKKILTEVKRLEKFYTAEDYHKHYYRENESAPYCRVVIAPKLLKLKKDFMPLLK